MSDRTNRLAVALRTYLSLPTAPTMTQLAESSGISLGDLSRIRAGHKRITFEALSRLVRAKILEWGCSVDLVLAYLRDETPPSHTDAVSIAPSASALLQDAPPPQDPLSSAVHFLADHAASSAPDQVPPRGNCRKPPLRRSPSLSTGSIR